MRRRGYPERVLFGCRLISFSVYALRVDVLIEAFVWRCEDDDSPPSLALSMDISCSTGWIATFSSMALEKTLCGAPSLSSAWRTPVGRRI